MYRATVWFVNGLRKYTKGGYDKALHSTSPQYRGKESPRVFVQEDMDTDLSGKICVVTGGNSGLGKHTALELARRNAIVHILCRNEKKGKSAIEEIKTETGNSNIFLHLVDLSDFESIFRFTTSFTKENKSLYCLVNNAGCMVNERTANKQGIESNFATNTLGTYILTEELIDILAPGNKKEEDEEKDNQPRVVTVSSGGMLNQKLDSYDLNHEKMKKFDGTLVYAQNKRQQVVMTEHWAEKYGKSKGIAFFSMHPGWADTESVRTAMPGFYERMKNQLRSTAEGADTIVFLSVVDFYKCLMFRHCYEEERKVREKGKRKGSNKSNNGGDGDELFDSPGLCAALNGQFYEDRLPVSTHIPLAWTRHSEKEQEELINRLDDFYSTFGKDMKSST